MTACDCAAQLCLRFACNCFRVIRTHCSKETHLWNEHLYGPSTRMVLIMRFADRWSARSYLSPKVCQSHSFTTHIHKSLARSSDGKCSQAEMGIWIGGRQQRYKLPVHSRNAQDHLPNSSGLIGTDHTELDDGLNMSRVLL